MNRLLVALTCCVPLWVSGCSDPAATSTPPPPPTTSTTLSPTSAATEHAETPEEFVLRWVEVNTEMQNSGNTKTFRRMSATCRPCLATADQVDAIYAAGGYVKTDGWTVNVARSSPSSRGSIELTIAVKSAPTEFKEHANAEVQTLTGGKFRVLMTLGPNGSSWIVTDLEQLAS